MLFGLRRSRRFAAAGLLGAFALLGAAEARAQDASGKAAAEALFDQGVQLMKNGRFSEACPKLETSQRVDPAVGTLLYLAECYERLGRTASAWATFREAESLARGANQADRARTAGTRAQKLEPELAYLTVNVPAEARVEGLVIKRGGAVVLPDLYGVAAPVDPGLIEIETSAPGHRRSSSQVKVSARGKEVVTVPKLEPEPGAEAPPVAPVVAGAAQSTTQPSAAGSGQPPKDDAPKSGPDHTLAFIVGGAGIVGIGVGSYFGLRAFSKNSDADEFCNEQNVCQKEGMDLSQDAENAALVSNIGFIFGGAALATSLVLFFTASDGEEKQTLRIAPTVAKNGGGVSIGGTFR
jgi:serine/threonine-protein kinase